MPSRGFARHFCALYSAECHLVRRTAGAAFPRKEQTGVGIGYVIASLDAESARGFINPTGWAFDFPKIPDVRFIHDHVALATFLLRAKFLVADRVKVAYRLQNAIRLFSIGSF